MFWWCLFILMTIIFNNAFTQDADIEKKDVYNSWKLIKRSVPISTVSWSLERRIPMTPENDEYARKRKKGKFKVKKKLKRMILPLLLAYKLKFFTLIPILVGGLLLLTTTTGLAGFFFALFAAAMGLRGGSSSG